jgi:hypothetical protein
MDKIEPLAKNRQLHIGVKSDDEVIDDADNDDAESAASSAGAGQYYCTRSAVWTVFVRFSQFNSLRLCSRYRYTRYSANY